MAGCAIDLGMHAIQWEEKRMLEIAHPIHSIVAFQTFRAILGLVACHKLSIFLGVAICASLRVELMYVARMAALAG